MKFRLPSLSRFSLRTLFVLVTVVAIPLGWLGRQYQIVRERKEVREWLEPPLSPWVDQHIRDGDKVIVIIEGPGKLPRIRTMLGDTELDGTYALPVDDNRRKRVLSLFPEARAYIQKAGRFMPLDELEN